jgi:CheY-like chemotaxis protein
MMVADELRNTYTVIEAATAHEALTILEGGTSVNLVLTDVKCPVQSMASRLLGQFGASTP